MRVACVGCGEDEGELWGRREVRVGCGEERGESGLWGGER